MQKGHFSRSLALITVGAAIACAALSGTSSIALVGAVARRAYSARQTLRRIANSHGFIAGPR
jgi:hypothetical protein